MAFIVAEIGVNWNGDLKLAKKMMLQAKKAGADAVKFQAFNEKIVMNHPNKKKLLKSAISKDNINDIHKIARSSGIEWFCTPMYPEAVKILEPFISRYKVREFDGRPLLKNKTSLLLKTIFSTKKEVMISSQKILPKLKNSRFIKWLYCVPKYPCSLRDLNFRNFKHFDGYSNHCTNFLAPLTATILGSKIIEVHITSDKSKKFFDNNVSFDKVEFQNLVKLIREVEKIRK